LHNMNGLIYTTGVFCRLAKLFAVMAPKPQRRCESWYRATIIEISERERGYMILRGVICSAFLLTLLAGDVNAIEIQVGVEPFVVLDSNENVGIGGCLSVGLGFTKYMSAGLRAGMLGSDDQNQGWTKDLIYVPVYGVFEIHNSKERWMGFIAQVGAGAGYAEYASNAQTLKTAFVAVGGFTRLTDRFQLTGVIRYVTSLGDAEGRGYDPCDWPSSCPIDEKETVRWIELALGLRVFFR
jgi:hypothetical protein